MHFSRCTLTHTHTHAKRAQYENSDLLGYAFVPLSTETFGRLGKPAMALLNKLAECASAGGVVFMDGFVVNALCELSVGLCRGQLCVVQAQSVCFSSCEWHRFPCRHPKLFKDGCFPFVLTVFQPLLGAVLLHSLCCNTLIKSPR